jgi:hypothetical protein
MRVTSVLLLLLLLAAACGGTSPGTPAASIAAVTDEPSVPADAVDPPADGVALGSYSCFGRPANDVRPDLDILDQGLYASLEQIGHFRYDPDTRRIEWLDGPLHGRGAWIAEYQRKGIDDVAYHTIRIRDRTDADEPGNERDLQWCTLLDGEPAAPVPVTPSGAPETLVVVVEVTGGPAQADLDLFVPHRISERVQVPYRSEHLVPLGSLVVVHAAPEMGSPPVGCVIRVEGGVAAEQAPGRYARCEAQIGE